MANNNLGTITSLDFLNASLVEGMDVAKLTRDQLVQAIDARLAARNAAINQIMGQLSRPTVQRGDLVGQHTEMGEWPKATEMDRGRRSRTSGLEAVGFPIFKFGPRRTAWTYDYLAKATNLEIAIQFEEVMTGHLTTNYKEALRALFNNAKWDWSDTLFPEDGTIKVMPLVAGESDFVPPEFQGKTFDSTHSHYLNCGDSTLAEDDLQGATDHIREHGYAVDPSVGGFGGTIVVWANSAEEAALRGHTGFVAANDPMVADINKIYAQDLVRDVYIGYNKTARCFIRIVPWMPAGYLLAFATTTLAIVGDNGFAPLRRRVPTSADLVGIKRFDDKTYPLQESWFQDFFGYGVGDRLSAAVLKKDSSYTIPTIS